MGCFLSSLPLGTVLGEWTLIEHTVSTNPYDPRARFKCSCGKEKVLLIRKLYYGFNVSCDHIRRHDHAHAGKTSITYKKWSGAKQRCLNNNAKKYPAYGGRGIFICDRWLDFKNFLADMGECPKGYSLDRIDNNSGYCPENCRWTTIAEQNRNKRNNVVITCYGLALVKADWCKLLGISDLQFNRLLLRYGQIEKVIPLQKVFPEYYS